MTADEAEEEAVAPAAVSPRRELAIVMAVRFAALPVAVAERRGTAWPSAVIEVRGPPVAGRLRALEVAPVRAALEQHLRLAKRLA